MNIEKNSKVFTKNIWKLNTLLLLLLSFFYLYRNQTIALIIITIPLAIESISLLLSVHRIKLKDSILLSVIIIVYTLLAQILMLKNPECLSFLFSISYFVLASTSISTLSKDDILKYLKWLLIFGIILLIFDTIYRFSNPLVSDYYVGINAYLKYKGPGILFVDTNNTGMLCLAFLGLLLYLDNIYKIKYKKINFIYFVLLILTFSRAAILAYFLLLFFINKRVPKWIKTIFFLIAMILVPIFIPKIFGDVSTGSKIDMFIRAIAYWKNASILEILFGVGFTNSIDKIGLFTHSWPLTFTFEFGVVGFFFIILFWYFMYKESNRKALYVLFPCLFAGISYLPLLIPYIYTFVVIITELEKKKGGCCDC